MDCDICKEKTWTWREVFVDISDQTSIVQNLKFNLCWKCHNAFNEVDKALNFSRRILNIQKRKDIILKIRGNKCEECGSTKPLDLHHIIPRKDKGSDSFDNLKLLCLSCHHQEHKSRK